MQRMSVVARVCVMVLAIGAVAGVLGSSAAFAKDNTGFGFNARDIRGGTAGAVSLTGGGAFDASTGFGHPGGGFSCTESVGQGPLAGCRAGEGTHWKTDSVLASTAFKCTSSSGEALKTATTSADTVALHAGFYRAGDGSHESFTANVFVSTRDLAPDIAGMQNVWVQGVGCGVAGVHFSS
jgi:hypothetical protein